MTPDGASATGDDPAAENAIEVAQDIAEHVEQADGARLPGAREPRLTTRQRVIVGVTFFSMFFGAGNLIFPPYLGALAGDRTAPGMLGFVLSAVGLPILGVIVVARAGGFSNLSARVSPRFALVLGVAIMLTIGPLFAIPRTASTSFEMAVAPFAGEGLGGARLIYSIMFFALAWLVAQRPDRLSQVLGKIMGPLLLIMIAVLFVTCLCVHHPPFAAPSGPYAHDQLMQGFLDGYQTMDLLAGLYFGIVISANIDAMGVRDERGNRRETALGGLSTGVMLVVIYAMLGFVGAVSGSYRGIDGATDTGATVLTNLTEQVFGHAGTVFVGVIFVVACFNVCAGLISTCSSYFHKQFPRALSYRAWTLVFALVALVIANIGLSAIINLSVPVLAALYPIAIVLVVLSLFDSVFTSRFPAVYFWTVLLTAIDSVANGVVGLVAAFGGRWTWLETACGWLPLNDLALGWLVPSALGVVIGVIVSLVRRRRRA
ncbi:branched-chain amino acid transport system II carrier protein [Bifidobacterium anseris]|nr:branched-chain amino acid transport system II carrier protein [Bifidobacterium anseris]